MIFSVILSIHVVACVLVILVVLVQSGKGAGIGGIFGGGGSDAVFSAPSGSQFIKKVTTGIAVLFFFTSLLLTYIGSRKGVRTVTRDIPYSTTTTTTSSEPIVEGEENGAAPTTAPTSETPVAPKAVPAQKK